MGKTLCTQCTMLDNDIEIYLTGYDINIYNKILQTRTQRWPFK